jgi:hypothetical protein
VRRGNRAAGRYFNHGRCRVITAERQELAALLQAMGLPGAAAEELCADGASYGAGKFQGGPTTDPHSAIECRAHLPAPLQLTPVHGPGAAIWAGVSAEALVELCGLGARLSTA